MQKCCAPAEKDSVDTKDSHEDSFSVSVCVSSFCAVGEENLSLARRERLSIFLICGGALNNGIIRRCRHVPCLWQQTKKKVEERKGKTEGKGERKGKTGEVGSRLCFDAPRRQSLRCKSCQRCVTSTCFSVSVQSSVCGSSGGALAL